MRAFYGQRCGTAVDMGPEFPGYSHPACHLHGEFHPSSGAKGPRDNIGGWHDAGDYGRYMVNSGITTGTLLWTWEIYGQKLKNISLKIPESGNGTPDILNEARWNLEWMLKMQDGDGGAWHKQTSEHFPGFIAPEDDKLPSEVIGTGAAPYKSTCATADLAAVGAIAARVYQPYDAKFAAQALEAARRAWAWTEKYPNVTFRNPPGRRHRRVRRCEAARTSGCGRRRSYGAPPAKRSINDFFLKNYAEFLPSLDSPPAENWNMLRLDGAVDLCALHAQGRGCQGGCRDPGADPGGGARGGGAHARQSLPREHAGQGLCVGLERRCGRIWHVSADCQRASAGSKLCGCGAGQSALSAGAKHVFAVLGDAGGRAPLPASASSAQRRRQAAWTLAGAAVRRAKRETGRMRCWQRFPRICRRPRSMPISWPRTQAMRFASTGRHRWCFCWRENLQSRMSLVRSGGGSRGIQNASSHSGHRHHCGLSAEHGASSATGFRTAPRRTCRTTFWAATRCPGICWASPTHRECSTSAAPCCWSTGCSSTA